MENNATFTMENGTITNCTGNKGGRVFVTTKIWNDDTVGGASFTMNGGTISNCTADNGAGVYVEAAEAASSDAKIFTMTNGAITDCKSTDGSPIWLDENAGFSMTGGTADGVVKMDGKIYLSWPRRLRRSKRNFRDNRSCRQH